MIPTRSITPQAGTMPSGIDAAKVGDGTVSNAEFERIDGLTSNAQTQITAVKTTADAALPRAGGTMTGNIAFSGAQTVDGRDVSVDGAKLDGLPSSAVPTTRNINTTAPVTGGGALSGDLTIAVSTDTATNTGAGSSGKLLKLDSNGKAAGRVLETDGGTIDAVAAKLDSVYVLVSEAITTGTANPLPLADTVFTGKTAGGSVTGNGTAGVVAASFSSSGAETGTGSGQGGFGSAVSATQPLNTTDFPGQHYVAAQLRRADGDQIVLLNVLSTALLDLDAEVYAYLVYRSDAAANQKWRLWFYYRRSSDGQETPITPNVSLTGCKLYSPEVYSILNKPVGSGIGTIAGGSAAVLAPGVVGTTELADLAVTSGKIAAGIDAVKIGGGTVSSTEFGYLDGVTGAVQTQIDAKAPTASPTFTGTTTAPVAVATTRIETPTIGTASNAQHALPSGTAALVASNDSRLSDARTPTAHASSHAADGSDELALFTDQAANLVFASPSSGGADDPAFRALVAADIPSLDTSKLTTGTLAAARLPTLVGKWRHQVYWPASQITTSTQTCQHSRGSWTTNVDFGFRFTADGVRTFTCIIEVPANLSGNTLILEYMTTTTKGGALSTWTGATAAATIADGAKSTGVVSLGALAAGEYVFGVRVSSGTMTQTGWWEIVETSTP